MTNHSYRNIIALALPVLLANIAMPAQGIIDIAIVGHFDEVSNLAGISIAIQLMTILLVSFNFLQYASSGLSSQVIGSNKNTNQQNQKLFMILQRALIVAIILGVVITVAQKWLIPIGISVLGGKDNTAVIANQYLSIRIWGIIAELMNYAFLGWFAGQGKTKFMLYQQSFIACANIVLTLTLVYVFDMKIAGVALGTTIAYWLGIGIAIAFVCQNMNISCVKFFLLDKTIFAVNELIKLFSLNRDIFIRTLILTLSFAWITRLSANTGEIVLATNVLLLQVLSLSSYALDGLAVATETLVGQHKGRATQFFSDASSNNIKYDETLEKNFKQILQRTCLTSFTLAMGLSILWWLAMPLYLYVMTDISVIYQLAYQYKWYAIVLPIIGVGAYWIDGVFFGLTDGSSIRNASIVVAIVFFPVSWLLYVTCDITGIWLSVWLILLLRFLILLIILIFKLNVINKNAILRAK